MRFLDQQPFFLQQSALQINFPPHQEQQQFDEQQQDNLLNHQQELHSVAQGYVDEGGNLCIIEYPDETLDGVVDATNTDLIKQFSRHSTREKTKSSQKRRKRRKIRQQQKKEPAKRVFGKMVIC